MAKVAFAALGITIAVLCAITAALVFGGPSQPRPMPSVNEPFVSVDVSDLPPIRRFTARDGAELAYREYMKTGTEAKGSVVLIHGSSSRSNSMHQLAKGLAESGYLVFALDMRGHGESGTKGKIAYIGQLEDDVEDFLKATRPPGRRSLVGFSAGGGFALRFAAGTRRDLFDNYVLLAPLLSQEATTYRPASGGWVSVGGPRIQALLMLNRIGISALNYLPVTAFALDPEAEQHLTPTYSFALAMNFRPHLDYRADIRAASRPMEVLVGENDDQFYADRFGIEFSIAAEQVPVSIVPSKGHVDLALAPAGVQAVVSAVGRLNARSDARSRRLIDIDTHGK
jgi:alpha-beta hydrolase superfamily lysophospholipase